MGIFGHTLKADITFLKVIWPSAMHHLLQIVMKNK